jgi:hypothetical protein
VKAGSNQHARRTRQGKRAADGVQAASRLPDSNRTRGVAASCRVPASHLDAEAEDVATLLPLHALVGWGLGGLWHGKRREYMEKERFFGKTEFHKPHAVLQLHIK